MMKSILGMAVVALLSIHTANAHDDARRNGPLVVTASNTAANQLMIYNANGRLLKTIPTQGQGGVAGNAGGIAYRDHRLAVVNFLSGTVSVFSHDAEHSSFQLRQVIQTLASPVSVAFSDDHLYVLTTTQVESHALDRDGVRSTTDGAVGLIKADGSAAQVGVLHNQLIVSEKSNIIETVNLNGRGAVTGSAQLVANIPTNVDAPFGLVTRGNNAYVTIAHADEISLVRNGAVLTTTASVTQHAPCWVALDGPYLFSANSPSKSVSRYAVYGQKII